MKDPPRRFASTEVLYGVHPVAEALAAGRRTIFEIYASAGKKAPWRSGLAKKARDRGIPWKEVPLSRVQELAKSPFTQGIAAVASPYPTLQNALQLVEEGPGDGPPFLLMADGVMDPGNLGALVRTGMCAGITGVVIPRDRCAPPTPAVSRASAGALEHMKMARVPNLVRAIREIKEKGLWVYGLDPAGRTSLFSVDFAGPVALVVGGEAKGLRPLVKRHCDARVSIPQEKSINSLNVSVAGGIAMYAVFRARMEPVL